MDAISRLLSDHRAFMNQAKQLNRAKADSKPDAAHNHSHFLNKNPAHRAAHDDLTVSARIVAALGQLLSPSMRRAIVEVFANAPWRFILPACSFCMAWMASQFMRGRAIGGMIDILFKSQMPLTEDASPAAASTAQPTLQAMLIMPVVFAFFEWLFNVLWDFCMMKAKTALIVTGRTRYFRSIISQSLEFHSGSSSAELAARLISDSEAIDDAIVHAPCHLLRGLFTLVVAAYVISIDAWLFALGLVLRLPWLLQFVEYAITVVASYELLESNASHLAQAHANEVFASIVTVQACTAEDDETQEFKGHLQNVSRIADTGSVVACGLRNVENGLTLASEIVILAYGVSRVYNGHLTFGIFMALKAHMEMFISQFNFFEKAYVALKRASVQSARMFHFYDLHASSGEVLQQLPVVAPKSGLAQHALSLQQHPIIVEFSNVSFSYPKLPSQAENIHMPVVLSGVSFFVIQRSLTAILGASGSGKSSIGKLLLQFYKPTSGDVHVDGVACKSPESAHRAREMIAWVDQGCCLLNRSIKDNLVMGLKTKPGDLQIHQACKIAHIHDHIESLPDKYHTLCGQRGSSLSGGQQQRLVIARALLREPSLLLLDEATSALDAETEDAIVSSLDQWRKRTGTTLLVITHRIRTVRGCDAAIVLNQGKVQEFGTKDELMAMRGHFYNEMMQVIPR